MRNDRAKKQDRGEVPKGHANKKNKTTQKEGEPPFELISATFGYFAVSNFSDGDAKLWMGRNEVDVEFSFKMGLRDAFYHGISILNHKNYKINDQDRAIKKWKGETSSNKPQLVEVQKKLHEEQKSRKDDVDKLLAEKEKLSVEVRLSADVLEKRCAQLEGELTELKVNQLKELSDAYSTDFLDNLQNFLAGDPEYNWVKNFAPSTTCYMAQFKADNAQAIEEVRLDLHKKINIELEVAAEV